MFTDLSVKDQARKKYRAHRKRRLFRAILFSVIHKTCVSPRAMLVITVRNLYFVDNVATRKYIRLKLSYFISGGKLSFNLQGIKIRKTGEII